MEIRSIIKFMQLKEKNLIVELSFAFAINIIRYAELLEEKESMSLQTNHCVQVRV